MFNRYFVGAYTEQDGKHGLNGTTSQIFTFLSTIEHFFNGWMNFRKTIKTFNFEKLSIYTLLKKIMTIKPPSLPQMFKFFLNLRSLNNFRVGKKLFIQSFPIKKTYCLKKFSCFRRYIYNKTPKIFCIHQLF